MEFTWDTANWLTATSIFIGFGLTCWQLHRTTQMQKAKFIHGIIEGLRCSPDSSQAMYLIEYNFEWYNEDFHGSGERERCIDNYFFSLSYVCYLRKTKNINANEFKILEYDLLRTCQSPCTQSYLWNLYHFAKHHDSCCSFDFLIKYAYEKKIIQNDFYDPESESFINCKCLNF